MRQPNGINTYCDIIVVVIPFLMAISSALYKHSFPLKLRTQCDEISAGIALHMEGETAPDPITHIPMPPSVWTRDELDVKEVLDSWPYVSSTEAFLKAIAA